MADLPTADRMIANAVQLIDDAYKTLGDAQDWLRSDWQPVGTPLTAEQATARRELQAGIGRAKTAINEAKNAAGR